MWAQKEISGKCPKVLADTEEALGSWAPHYWSAVPRRSREDLAGIPCY